MLCLASDATGHRRPGFGRLYSLKLLREIYFSNKRAGPGNRESDSLPACCRVFLAENDLYERG